MTTLLGTLLDSDGNLVTGTLYLQLSQPANLLPAGGGPAVVPNEPPAIFNVTNGALSGPGTAPYSVYGADVLTPSGLTYHMIVTKTGGAVAVERDVSITGASVDLGQLPSLTAAAALSTAAVLSGDTTGPATANVVSRLQGRALASTAPADTDVIAWDAGGATWKPVAASPLTTKGDIYTRRATGVARKAAGPDGTVLVYDSTQVTGLNSAVVPGIMGIPIAPGSGGTGTATVFTAGRVVYAGAAGVYAQDAGITYDQPSGRLKTKLSDKGGQVFNVMAYGAANDGNTDDTAAIQAAFNDAAVAGGTVAFPPGGSHRISSALTLTNASRWHIEGNGATLYTSSATADMITVSGGGASSINRLTLMPYGATVRTAGAAIGIANGHNVMIRDCVTWYQFVGLRLDGGGAQYIYQVDHCEINAGTVGALIGNTGVPAGIYIRNSTFASQVSHGVHVKAGSGIYLTDTECISAGGNGLRLESTDIASPITWVFANAFQADTGVGAGIYLTTAGTGYINGVELTNCWGASGTGTAHGFLSDGANVDGVSLVGFRALGNGGAGIRLAGGKNYQITAPEVYNNSRSGAAAYSGIEIADTTGWSVVGGRSGLLGAGPNNQAYGLNVSGTCDDYLVEGIVFNGNVTGSALNTASGLSYTWNSNTNREQSLAIVAGLNSDLALSVNTKTLYLSGAPGAPFSIGGFQGPGQAREINVLNLTGQQLTIVNEDASSTAANRIATLTGANVVLRAGNSAFRVVWDLLGGRWTLVAYN